MPELPEVETIKNDLKKRILGKQITKLKIVNKKSVKGDLKKFNASLLKNSFRSISRIGKLLIFEMDKKDAWLLIHLKMTGQLIYKHKNKISAGGHSLSGRSLKEEIGGDLPNKYSCVFFGFRDGGELFFNDMRRFGYLKIVGKEELDKIKAGYGIEPLTKNFKLKDLQKILANRKTKIKSALLNQKFISGIGNIYADEILFASNIRPDREAGSLNKKEIESIFNQSKIILKKAIKHRGTTFSDYVDSRGERGNFSRFLRVYGREGDKCHKCKNPIKKAKIAGRTARYCEKCQK